MTRALALALVILAASGCAGGDASEPPARDAATSATPTDAGETTASEETTEAETTTETAPTETAPEQEPAARRLFQVWFTQGDLGLELAWLDAPSSKGVGADALRYLLVGAAVLIGEIPDAGVPAGAQPFTLEPLDSQIPPGTRLLGLDLVDGVATVDLSRDFLSRRALRSRAYAAGQVVYTLTQFPSIRAVRFRVEGRPVAVPSGKGVSVERNPSRNLLERPVTRMDYEDLLPAIVVESPAWGERVVSPLAVSGTANVFEANVTLRILDARGRELARTFTTATCGSGCRGTFAHQIPFRIRRAQQGTVVAQDDDADGDGFPSHSLHIPVVLAP